ncbi:jg10942 [Pararge aegeria aegeria]|uniref:Jg10942 protein n=1 Tax=Pararge aegeria aegeria TaxID=348720 RepID=A0A8S4S785_9NEOP|nr:jg10942 [Pararge aegeria aegeria]
MWVSSQSSAIVRNPASGICQGRPSTGGPYQGLQLSVRLPTQGCFSTGEKYIPQNCRPKLLVRPLRRRRGSATPSSSRRRSAASFCVMTSSQKEAKDLCLFQRIQVTIIQVRGPNVKK